MTIGDVPPMNAWRGRCRYLQECLDRRAPPDVWFLADPASTAADLRACLLPRTPSVSTVCRVRAPYRGS